MCVYVFVSSVCMQLQRISAQVLDSVKERTCQQTLADLEGLFQPAFPLALPNRHLIRVGEMEKVSHAI